MLQGLILISNRLDQTILEFPRQNEVTNKVTNQKRLDLILQDRYLIQLYAKVLVLVQTLLKGNQPL